MKKTVIRHFAMKCTPSARVDNFSIRKANCGLLVHIHLGALLCVWEYMRVCVCVMGYICEYLSINLSYLYAHPPVFGTVTVGTLRLPRSLRLRVNRIFIFVVPRNRIFIYVTLDGHPNCFRFFLNHRFSYLHIGELQLQVVGW